MTHKDNRPVWKMQGRCHCLKMVLSVYYVWRFANLVEIVDNGDSRRLQFFGHSPEHGAVGDRIVSFSNKPKRQITNIEF